MPRKSETRWPNAHHQLKMLYEERVEQKGETLTTFGKRSGIGSPAMVWQYLSGYTPLNYDAAARFAKALECRIEDFSPEMAEELASKIIPLLKVKTLKRAVKAAMAALVLLSVIPEAQREAHASFDIKVLFADELNTHMRKFLRFIGLLPLFLTGL